MHSVDTPHLTEVVARLAALLGPRTGDVQPLKRGLTGRSFKVGFGGSDYIVQLSSPRSEELGIDRDTECMANKAAGDMSIAPAVAAMLHDPHCLVTQFVEGRQPSSEELRGELLPQVARALRTFHRSGATLPAAFDPYRTVERYGKIARGGGVDLPGYEDALRQARKVEKALAGQPEHRPVPCHNDLVADNFIHAGGRLLLADWEFAGMGDAFFDLASFSANNELGEDDEDRLLEAYFEEPPTDRRRGALRVMRFVSDFREAMWGYVQGESPELDLHEYSDRHFARARERAGDSSFRPSVETARGR